MYSHPIRKGLIALAGALGLLVMLASPSAALPPDITGGTLTVHTDPEQVFDMGPRGPEDPVPPCDPVDDTLNVTFNRENPDNPGTPHQGTWSATGGFKGHFQLPGLAQWYQADFTLLSATGTFTGTGSPYAMASSAPNHVTVSVTIYAVSAGNCAKSLQNRVCVLAGRMVLTAGSQHNGSIPPATGDTTVLNGTSNTTGGLALSATSCQQPFSSMHTKHFTVAGMTFTH